MNKIYRKINVGILSSTRFILRHLRDIQNTFEKLKQYKLLVRFKIFYNLTVMIDL